MTSSTTLPLPRRYVARIRLDTGTPLSGGLVVAAPAGAPAFSGGVQAPGDGRAFVHLHDSGGAWGVWRIGVEAGRLAERVKVLRAGDVLADGTSIEALAHGDGNRTGTFVTVARRTGRPACVLAWTPVGGARVLLEGDVHPVVSVNDQNDVLAIIRQNGQAQLVLISAARPAAPQVLLSGGDLLVDTQSVIASLGFSHMTASMFTVQGTAAIPGSRPGEPLAASFVVKGVVGSRPTLVAAPDPLRVTPSRRAAGDFQPLACITAPRVGGDGRHGALLHASAHSVAMCVDGRTVKTSGDATPRGNTISAFLPPVLGDGGHFCYQAVGAGAMELVRSDGESHQTLLASGDELEGRVVKTLVAGITPRQMRADGGVLLVVEFVDATSALVEVEPA